jgi:hypothetical protein
MKIYDIIITFNLNMVLTPVEQVQENIKIQNIISEYLKIKEIINGNIIFINEEINLLYIRKIFMGDFKLVPGANPNETNTEIFFKNVRLIPNYFNNHYYYNINPELILEKFRHIGDIQNISVFPISTNKQIFTFNSPHGVTTIGLDIPHSQIIIPIRDNEEILKEQITYLISRII